MMTQTLDETNVFVKYLPPELDDQALNDLFSQYGPIVSSKVMIDHKSKTSLGYGFVRFTTAQDTQNAIAGLSGHKIHNKVLLCKLSNSSPNIVTPEISTNLYIKPLLPSTTEESLRAMFSEFGTIATAKVMVDKNTGESRQIGFVRYENQEDATHALNAMNGLKLAENQQALIVKYAETEIQRSARKLKPNPSGYPSPPLSPTSSGPQSPSSFYYQPSPMLYSYMPIPLGYNMAPMLPYSHAPIANPYSLWRPPYVLGAEQMLSY